MKKNLFIGLILFLFLSLFSISTLAQSIGFSFSPRLWGLDFFVYINDFPAKIGDLATFQTIIGVGGGWETYGYFRDASNNPVPYVENSNFSFYFNRINVIGTFGISYLFAYNEFYGKYLGQFRLKFISDFQSYSQESDNKPTYLSTTNLSDKKGIFQNSLTIEFYLDMLKYSSKFHTIKGLDFLINYDIFPSFINEIADFTRLQARIRGYAVIVENENFSVYIADKLHFYYIPISSNYIPVSALTMGSLGYVLRGVNWCQYEGTIRLTNNFDIRFFLPTIFNQSFIYPGLILFFDIGANDYENLDNKLDFSKMEYSTGAALVLVVFGIDLLDFYLDYNIKTSQLSFKLRFSLFF